MPYGAAMDAIPDPQEPCPHWFWRGVVAGARASKAAWSGRREWAVCVLCRELVEFADRRGSVLGTNPPPDPPSAADSRSLPGVPAPGELAGTAQKGDDTAAPSIPEG